MSVPVLSLKVRIGQTRFHFCWLFGSLPEVFASHSYWMFLDKILCFWVLYYNILSYKLDSQQFAREEGSRDPGGVYRTLRNG